MAATHLQEPRAKSGRHFTEIDLLRALAGVLMISNHAGVTWLSDAGWRHGLNGAITFIGSLAPVFFFTVTGLGRGIQAAGRAPKPLSDPLRKALVLFIADAAFWLSPTRHLGLDFLGFIGLSAIALEVLDRTRRPATAIALAMIACLALRFGVAPRLGLPADGGLAVRALHFVLGDAGVPGVSYPLCPWLAYPLFGWLVGRFAASHADRIRASRLRSALLLAAVAICGLGLCLMMLRRQMVFFRWGTLSFAFCLLGFAAVIGGMSLMLAAVRALPAKLATKLALPGIASFVLVPIHYALIGVTRPLFFDLLGRREMVFPAILLVLVPTVFLISKWIDVWMRQVASTGKAGRQSWRTPLLVATLALLSVDLATANPDSRALIRLIVQLLATGLFVLSSRPPAARS